MSLLKVSNIRKSFGKTEVLKGIDFSMEKGDVVAIIGSSGSGKTTLLRCLNFLETPDVGTISLGEKIIFDAENHKKLSDEEIRQNRLHFGLVFQSFNLFPQYNVKRNLTLAAELLENEKIKKGTSQYKNKKEASEAISVNADILLEEVGLSEKALSYPCELSGGQQQRVAIARAIANQPKVLLLDEPLAALDLKMRKDMQIELKEMHRKLGITFIYVTHDQEEALTLSDTIIVMNEGKIQQIGTPTDIYNEPQNSFVADFIGESNILNGKMVKDRLVEFVGHEFECVDEGFGENVDVDVVVRPEDIYIMNRLEGAQFTAKVKSCTFKGVHYEMFVDTDKGYELMIQDYNAFEPESEVGLIIRPADIQVMHKERTCNTFEGEIVDETHVKFLDETFECLPQPSIIPNGFY